MTMRVKALGSFVATAVALVAFSVSTPSNAATEYNVAVHGTSVDVTTAEPWHINLDAPWKVVTGPADHQTTIAAKDKFQLAKGKATVSGLPKGDHTLKVYVCNGGTCLNKDYPLSIK